MGNPSRSLRHPEFLVASFAFLLRCVVLAWFATSPYFEPISAGSDRSFYLEIAQGVASGSLMPAGVFEYMPLYGWYLGAVCALLGSSLIFPAILGAALDACTTYLIVTTALRVNARREAALAAGLLYALYPLAALYAIVPMPNSLNAFLLTAFTRAALSVKPEGSIGSWAAVGILAGVTCLSFAGMLLIVPACLAYWLIVAGSGRSMCAAKCAVFLAAVALPMAPVTLHNFRAEGKFVLVTAHGGFNFYMGNHEGATGYPVQIGDFRADRASLLADARREAELAAGRKLSAAEFSTYWSDKAKVFLREHPAAALRLFAVKLLKFWNRVDFDDLRLMPMLSMSGLPCDAAWWIGFMAIGTFGLAGLVLARGRGLLKLVVVVGMFSLACFFITARYRLTLVPLLCVLGAAGISDALESERRILRAVVVLVAAFVVAIPFPQSDFRAQDQYNAAAYLLARGRAEEALAHAGTGLAIDAQHAGLYFVKGNALVGLGQWSDAVGAYGEAIRIKPDFPDAHFNLAVSLKNMGDRAGALREAEACLAIDPSNVRAAALKEELAPR